MKSRGLNPPGHPLTALPLKDPQILLKHLKKSKRLRRLPRPSLTTLNLYRPQTLQLQQPPSKMLQQMPLSQFMHRIPLQRCINIFCTLEDIILISNSLPLCWLWTPPPCTLERKKAKTSGPNRPGHLLTRSSRKALSIKTRNSIC